VQTDGIEKQCVLSVIIPCYHEERTLRDSVERLLTIQDANLSLEVIIVDDGSTDKSYHIALELAERYPEIKVQQHQKNQGKGAALRTGFAMATGDYVAIHDADLEYDPKDLKKLLLPLRNGEADVVLGSRFLTSDTHRVLYFWHSVGNRMLTLLSNMFTDLNLTDMETCYKVFRRDVIQSVDIEESRFGFEPEIVAKIAHMRLRIFEMGISYYGRTYDEGKKIGLKDAFRALFCIFKYNAHRVPVPIQFMIYLFIGGTAALINLLTVLGLVQINVNLNFSIIFAFIFAALINYFLCVLILFRRGARWSSANEVLIFACVVLVVSSLDFGITKLLLSQGMALFIAKLIATAGSLIANFAGRRYLVFPEKPSGPWKSTWSPTS
jgi:glycosyltransferase involved in cell wall biosynthesis